MRFKKGAIIPRWLVRCKNQKTQYAMKFGADVEVIGRTIKMLSDGCAIVMPFGYIGGKKGKPRIYIRVEIANIHVIGFGQNSPAINKAV